MVLDYDDEGNLAAVEINRWRWAASDRMWRRAGGRGMIQNAGPARQKESMMAKQPRQPSQRKRSELANHRQGGAGALLEEILADAYGDKEFIEREVYECILRGEQELVREYCKLDVVSTMLVFLKWLVQRGDLVAGKLTELVAEIRETLAQESFEGWREIVEGLQEWPAEDRRP